MEIAISLITLLLFGAIYLIVDLIKDKRKLSQTIVRLEKKLKFKQQFIVGEKGIIANYELYNKNEKKDFIVNYEVEILEVSDRLVKVKAIDVTSLDNFTKDPVRKKGTLLWFGEQWISMDKVKMIETNRSNRNKRLEKVLS